MRRKEIVAIMITLFVAGSLFAAIPVKASPDVLKVGIFGPMRLIQGVGMLEGAQIAVDYIDANPINIGGTPYTVDLIPVDSALGNVEPEPTVPSGAGAMSWLLGENPDLIAGGFRSEAVFGARALWPTMTDPKLWFICGAATNHLIDCGGPYVYQPGYPTTCGACVRCEYDTWKYHFRNTPPNVSCLLKTMAYFTQMVIMANLVPKYMELAPGPCQYKLRVGVLCESAVWAQGLWYAFTNPAVYPAFLGPYAYVDPAACYQVAPDDPDVSWEMSQIDNAGARLIIEILSGEVGRTAQMNWNTLELKSVLWGINVLSQMSETWDITGGGCETETFLATTGTRTPLSTTSSPYTTTEFWDIYLGHASGSVDGWDIFAESHKPIYTSWGMYQSLITMKQVLETPGVPQPPYNTKAKADALVPYFEQVEVDGVMGKFKYTGPHPDYPGQPGSLHDPYSPEAGPYWIQGYGRTLVVQWQAGRHEVVWPIAETPDPYKPLPYAKTFALPRVMYPYPQDVNLDGSVDVETDVAAVGLSFGATPGHPRWQFVADVDYDGTIDPDDHVATCAYNGKYVDLPLAYGDEEGHWKP